MPPLLRVLAMVLVFCVPTLAQADPFCRSVTHLGQGYTVCSFNPAEVGIRMFNVDGAGLAYRSFQPLVRERLQQREYMPFAMNGGMYHSDLSPVGLFIEDGIERKAISTRAGWGNFHLQPNGVFYVEQGKAGVLETNAYIAAGKRPRFATQSGPMLVIDGRLHPSFLPQSDSLKIRNGVGVDRNGIVHFALSEGFVRFHDFATLFRDALGCDNALFLDGSISSLYAPEIGRQDSLFPMGPIIAVIAAVPR